MDSSKLKRRNRLGPPPEGMVDLGGGTPSDAPRLAQRIDGRTLNRSGRTEAFALRVTSEFGATVRQIAAEDGIRMVEVMERALALLVSQRDRS